MSITYIILIKNFEDIDNYKPILKQDLLLIVICDTEVFELIKNLRYQFIYKTSYLILPLSHLSNTVLSWKTGINSNPFLTEYFCYLDLNNVESISDIDKLNTTQFKIYNKINVICEKIPSNDNSNFTGISDKFFLGPKSLLLDMITCLEYQSKLQPKHTLNQIFSTVTLLNINNYNIQISDLALFIKNKDGLLHPSQQILNQLSLDNSKYSLWIILSSMSAIQNHKLVNWSPHQIYHFCLKSLKITFNLNLNNLFNIILDLFYNNFSLYKSYVLDDLQIICKDFDNYTGGSSRLLTYIS